MSKQTNYRFNIYLRFLGLIATTLQFVQFFNGLWAFDTKFEIFMLILSLALALNPTKYLDKILDAVLTRIKGGKDEFKEDYNEFEGKNQQLDTGGSSVPPEKEERL